ncbi:MAG: hypothetical protein Q8O43_01425 [Dehalococcoidia bacterium]|nr:hypothetical protein [Dehalococcoidia bacterium]
MREFADIVELFASLVDRLKKGTLTLDAGLDTIVRRISWDELAYLDDRKGALEESYDFWKGIAPSTILAKKISKKQLYSQSQVFPDFVYKVRERDGRLIHGSLLETKDTSGSGISSFNSTIPTQTKSLQEIDALNNKVIVSRVASVKDGLLADAPEYYSFQRRCFYFIRTFKNSPKVKLSLVDGSFFETLPKDRLISQMFLNILEQHRVRNKLDVSLQALDEIKKVLAQITDQAIIAGSQSIERASIKPRLRIMAEVNPEGNPHSRHYPEIKENTVNFILPERLYTQELGSYLRERVPGLNESRIQHKRNGKYAVFYYKMD